MKKIIFNIDPVAKPRMTRASAKFNHKYWAFKDELNLKANLKKYKLGETLDIIFFIPMPKSWSKKKKDRMNFSPHRQKPDLDNLVKAFADALRGEDKEIWLIRCCKYWAIKGRIEIEEPEPSGAYGGRGY